MNDFRMSQLLGGHTYTKKLHVVYLKFKFNCVLYFLCALTPLYRHSFCNE